MGNLVPKVLTRYSEDDLAKAVVTILRARLGSEPNKSLCELALALCYQETANAKSVYNNNFGNVVVFNNSQDYFMFDGNDRHFRSFDNIEEGMNSMLFELIRRREWLAAAIDGDVDEFAKWYSRDTVSAEGRLIRAYCPDCASQTNAIAGSLFSKVVGFKARNLFAAQPSEAPTVRISLPSPKVHFQPSQSSGSPVGSFTRPSRYSPAPGLPLLRRGDRGYSVGVWQRLIGAEVDEYFGPITEHLTKTLQDTNQISGTGVVDADTWKVFSK